MTSTFQPQYSPWRHGGWYVDNIRYPSGAVGCVSRNYPDRKWRIVCDERTGEYTYPSRDAAARAERALAEAMVDAELAFGEPRDAGRPRPQPHRCTRREAHPRRADRRLPADQHQLDGGGAVTYTKSLTVAETAKELRKALKAEFPGVKFSVRSDSYAGGASIRVRWTDGPREQLVKRVCARFEGASFDGMIDLKSYHTTVVANPDGSVEEIHYGADFIFADRDVSPERDALIRELYEHCIGRPYDPSDSERLPDSYRVSDPRVDWDEVLRGVRGIWSSSLYGAIERVV